MRCRYEKQLQQEEEALQQQRRRLHAEVHEEKERLTAQAARQRQELDRLQLKLEESQASSVQTMRIEYEKARDEQERRHAVSGRLNLKNDYTGLYFYIPDRRVRVCV